MRNLEKDAIEMADRRQKLIETGYRLFTERGIDQVPLEEVAKQSSIGIATLYRYFKNKQDMVIAIGTHIWNDYNKEYNSRSGRTGKKGKSGKEEMAEFLDYFLELYRDHRDMLRFNQFFNIYIENTGADIEQLAPYKEMVDAQADYFRRTWEKGQKDHTLRDDMNWKQVFSACLHIMMAAVTRYAVGLVYKSDEAADVEQELMLLKDVLLERFSV